MSQCVAFFIEKALKTNLSQERRQDYQTMHRNVEDIPLPLCARKHLSTKEIYLPLHRNLPS